MFKPTMIALATAALAGQATAFNTCDPGRVFCGYELTRNDQPQQDRDYWEPLVLAALQRAGQPPSEEFQSTFVCIPGNDVDFVQYCAAAAGGSCQPADNDVCRALGPNSCCVTA